MTAGSARWNHGVHRRVRKAVGASVVTDSGDGLSAVAVPPTVGPGPDAGAGVVWSPIFVALYQERYLAMVRLAYLLVGSNSVAEEIVQEAFVRVRLAIDTVHNPRAYLRVAVVNACHNQRRREGVEQRYQHLERTPDPAPEDELRDALAKLPGRQRAVLVLRYYEGMTEAEIADALGCRRGTVKSAAARGLAQLRRVIEP
jgi:RNA polymerase sigma-70 factor (sigma-E family)